MNLTELAALAGVSVSTVSKAFSGSGEISEETRERIFAVARKNDCFDKYNKNKFGKKIIAVICPEIVSEYYSAMTEQLMRELSAHNAITSISVTHFNRDIEKELYTYYSSYSKVDGIILINSGIKITDPSDIPTVAIAPSKSSENIDSVHTNFKQAILDAVRHLKSLGHTKIGFAGEALTSSKMQEFKVAVRTAGLPVYDEYICVSNERFERAGTDIAKRWIKGKNIPTAVIAAYDYIALGIIREFTENGYLIPRDISVIGMDDIARAQYLSTSLSSIHYPTVEICKEAVNLIMKKIDNQYYHARQKKILISQYVPRESTGKAPKD